MEDKKRRHKGWYCSPDCKIQHQQQRIAELEALLRECGEVLDGLKDGWCPQCEKLIGISSDCCICKAPSLRQRVKEVSGG